MLSVICFSKDRPLQLDAFLASLHFFSAIPFRQVCVIYTVSAGISYEGVMGAYPEVVWIRETDFIGDFRRCVEAAHEFLMLCCDDMVFKGTFSADAVVNALNERPDALAFNLKLGANLHSLPRLKVEGELLSWNWRAGYRSDWYFPWDVSGAVYRREFVTALLDRYHELSSPNRLELYIACGMPDDAVVTQSTLLCFWTSKCVVPTVNRVQKEFGNGFDDSRTLSAAALYGEYLAGKRLYWPAFAQRHYSHSHISGRDFTLVQGTAMPNAAELQSMKNGISAGVLARRIAFWNVARQLKQGLRPLIPTALFVLVRKALRGFRF